MEVMCCRGGGACLAASAGKAAAMALAKQLDQLGAQGAAGHGVDGAIDGLVRDGQGAQARRFGLHQA